MNRITFLLMLSSLRRRPKTSVMLCIIALFSVFSVVIVSSLTERQEQALQKTVAETVISCTVTDVTGSRTDNLDMASAYVDMFLGLRHERGCYLDEYVTNVRSRATFPLEEPEGMELCRILNLQSDSRLSPVEGCQVRFYSGWNEADLSKKQQVCIVPEDMRVEAEEGSEFVTVTRMGQDFSLHLQVIGRFSGKAGQTIFCPFSMEEAAGISQSFPVDSCSFDIKENAALAESKEAFWDSGYFVAPSTGNRPSPLQYGIAVHDTVYLDTIRRFENSLRLLQITLPTLYFLTGAISFFSSCFAMRSRKRELAVMRCMGLRRSRVALLIFGEQVALAIPGCALGLLAGALWNGSLSVATAASGLGMLGVFLVGSLFAALYLSGRNPIKIMKTEE